MPQSLIKPHLKHLSGSGDALRGVVVERNVERANYEFDTCGIDVPNHVIVVPVGGPATLEWTIDGITRRALFSGDEAIVNPAGLFVAPRWDSEIELILIAIEPAFINGLAEDAARSERGHRVELVPHFHVRDPLLRAAAQSLIAEFEQPDPRDVAYAEALACAVGHHLVRHYASARTEEGRLRAVLSKRQLARLHAHIVANLDSRISSETLAEVADVSQSHFATLFRRTTGQSAHQYVISLRLERARALLMQSTLPIAEIAMRTGFADQSHLTRLMRRYAGYTPRKLRAGLVGEIGGNPPAPSAMPGDEGWRPT